jgi:hypothetical protein
VSAEGVCESTPLALARVAYLVDAYRLLQRDLMPEAPAVESVALAWELPARRRRGRSVNVCRHLPVVGSNVEALAITVRWGADDVEVLQGLAHQMIHAVVGLHNGHRPPFGRLAERIGLAGPAATSIAAETFREAVARLRLELPAFPEGGMVLDEGLRKQRTRLRLWECSCVPPVKARVSRDDFDATCKVCGRAFRIRIDAPRRP